MKLKIAALGASFLVLILILTAQSGLYQTPVTLLPVPQGGTLIFRSLDLDETEEEVSATPAQIYGWYLFNGAASPNVRYFKFYNKTAADTVVGTTVPVLTIPLPPGAGANVPFPDGIEFRTALTAACTTGVADNDTGAPGANECILNLFYKN